MLSERFIHIDAMQNLYSVFHYFLVTQMADRSRTSTGLYKFAPLSLKKSDTDWLSLSKERNCYHSEKRVKFSLFYIKRDSGVPGMIFGTR